MEQLSEETSAAKAALMEALQASSESSPHQHVACVCHSLFAVLPRYQALHAELLFF